MLNKTLRILVSASVAALALWSTAAQAAVPSTTAIEGVLQSGSGTPAADGIYNVTFAIFKDAVGGNPVWSEGPVGISLKSGTFQYNLGSKTPLTAAVLSGLPTAHMSMKVESDPELPRQPMVSVAFALRAAVAEGIECSGCVGASAIDPQVLAAYAKTSDLTAYAKTGSLAKVATTGAFADLTGGPDLSGYAKTTDLAAYAKAASLAKVAGTGAYADLSGAPDLSGYAKATDLSAYVKAASLATVAGTGSYKDLTDKPVIPDLGKKCGTGLVMNGINADGSYACIASAIAADMIDEISNGLIWNQFVDATPGTGTIKIPDGLGAGTTDTLNFPDIGQAQKIWINMAITNSDLSGVRVELYGPGISTPYVLYNGGKTGTALTTNFNSDTPIVSGDLNGDWVNKNIKGAWSITVKDLKAGGGAGNPATDGTFTWAINIQTLSNQKIRVAGSMFVDKNVTVTGDLLAANVDAHRGYKQAVWQNSQLDMTSGSYANARQITYTKTRDNTNLIIDFTENVTIRSYAGGWNTAVMRILIDGQECANPGKIERGYPHYSPSPDIYFTDNMSERAVCKATTAGPILAGNHTITVQGRRGYCGGNCWGPYWSYNINNDESRMARLGVGEIQDNQ
ncbi:MAG: hypothetical protein HY902_20585 [Deltaproteobacteria bacterium]|nr:hypothetical protein [Deltaproteobacteria bacterium]